MIQLVLGLGQQRIDFRSPRASHPSVPIVSATGCPARRWRGRARRQVDARPTASQATHAATDAPASAPNSHDGHDQRLAPRRASSAPAMVGHKVGGLSGHAAPIAQRRRLQPQVGRQLRRSRGSRRREPAPRRRRARACRPTATPTDARRQRGGTTGQRSRSWAAPPVSRWAPHVNVRRGDAGLGQDLAQACARLVQLRLRGAHVTAEHAGDLLVLEPLDVVQDDHGAVADRVARPRHRSRRDRRTASPSCGSATSGSSAARASNDSAGGGRRARCDSAAFTVKR